MKPVLTFQEETIPMTDLGERSCLPDLSGEVIIQNYLKFDLSEDDELFEGYGQLRNAYPYRKFDSYNNTLTEKPVRTAVLENDFLQAVFLPELGGRLWRLIDKETGCNLLYTNDVIQFRNFAVCNAWFSGGVEWNVGIIGHTPFTTAPLYTATLQTEGGDPVLRMYEYEAIREVTYQMDFWLEEDSRFLNCRMRLANDGDETVPMYWWSNIASPEYEKGRIVVPADEAYGYEEGRIRKVPVPGSFDQTEYRHIPSSCDHFFDIPEVTPRYIANLNREGYGLLQYSTQRLRGRKLFSWGHTEASDRWQEYLTRDAGPYLEIQAGLGKTQYGCIPMPPHRVWEWMEQYGAVRLPQELMCATPEARHQALTKKLAEENRIPPLEEKLCRTKAMAKQPAALVSSGSCQGAFAKRGVCTAHLEFTAEGEGAEQWNTFLTTGKLHEPAPQERPWEFFCDKESFALLKKTAQEQNRDNWYAHYLLGVRYYENEEYSQAEAAWSRSLSLKENPWALHGLACATRLDGRLNKSIAYMEKGIGWMKTDCSYLKEGFRLLHLCGGFETIIRLYDRLAPKEQEIPRVKFYCINAWHRLGQHQKAMDLLEENGGLDMEDLREGEDSITQLWKELHTSLYGDPGTIPHRYHFKD